MRHEVAIAKGAAGSATHCGPFHFYTIGLQQRGDCPSSHHRGKHARHGSATPCALQRAPHNKGHRSADRERACTPREPSVLCECRGEQRQREVGDPEPGHRVHLHIAHATRAPQCDRAREQHRELEQQFFGHQESIKIERPIREHHQHAGERPHAERGDHEAISTGRRRRGWGSGARAHQTSRSRRR